MKTIRQSFEGAVIRGPLKGLSSDALEQARRNQNSLWSEEALKFKDGGI